MNRADRLRAEGEGRRGNIVGFALTVLQRRLASSPEAIYQSLRRRRERLETRLNEERLGRRGREEQLDLTVGLEAPEDIDDLPEGELAELEEEVVDQASAAQSIAELEAEIATLRRRATRWNPALVKCSRVADRAPASPSHRKGEQWVIPALLLTGDHLTCCYFPAEEPCDSRRPLGGPVAKNGNSTGSTLSRRTASPRRRRIDGR